MMKRGTAPKSMKNGKLRTISPEADAEYQAEQEREEELRRAAREQAALGAPAAA
jgi:hypothetical protein